ncbi:MAG: glycosyltransferase family 39 protein [Candidatus Roizmanbacteria bacterium]|nr:MAG: glycosyltransferase family 39 protein [Candidatus Roizmanbacteria bacterium]
MKKAFLFLILITFFGFWIRIYNVGTAPSGMLIDEVSHGYNAYSILKTGKDEFGTAYPLTFKAFGDYKLPAYIYSSIPFIKTFGLNSFSVRLPSVIAGTLLIIAVYFLFRSLSFSFKNSLIAALITAGSPWTIILSRFAWESNLALLFFTTGIIFLLRSLSKNNIYYLILTGFFFGLTWYSYITYRLITMLLIIPFTIYLIKTRYIKIPSLLIIATAFLIVISPLIPSLFSTSGTARLKQTSILSKTNTTGALEEINESRIYCTEKSPKILCYLNSNKILVIPRIITERYFEMFSLNFLFVKGEEARYLSIANFGLLPIFLVPFFLFGFVKLIDKSAINGKDYIKIFLVLGLLISGLPSSLAGAPQRVQLSALYPFVLILMMLGFIFLKEKIKINFIRNIYGSLTTILLIFFALFFLFNYTHVHLRKFEITYNNYIAELMQYISKQNKETQIYIKDFFPHPIMYYAFYSKLDPKIYQQSVNFGLAAEDGFFKAVKLGNINIQKEPLAVISCKAKQNNTPTLIITDEKIPAKTLYIGMNTDKVLGLFYAYDSESLINNQVSCNNLLKTN